MTERVVRFPFPSSFTLSAQGILRALITPVRIGQAFNPASSAPPILKEFKAIWDTGATNSVITPKVVNECQLKAIGKTLVQVVDEPPKPKSVYLISMMLPNKMGIPDVRVSMNEISSGIDVLIGMDVIQRGDFAITNCNGKTVFTFRMPSCEPIDFVKQKVNIANPLQIKDIQIKPSVYPPLIPSLPKPISKNQPCPCGSGKKYKRCCMNKDQQQPTI
jgi:hypothetical protein